MHSMQAIMGEGIDRASKCFVELAASACKLIRSEMKAHESCCGFN